MNKKILTGTTLLSNKSSFSREKGYYRFKDLIAKKGFSDFKLNCSVWSRSYIEWAVVSRTYQVLFKWFPLTLKLTICMELT